MALTCEQQQYIWDVMADIYSRKLGVTVEFTRPVDNKNEQDTTSTELNLVASEA